MRHNMNHRKFNRTTNQRKGLLTTLAVHLIDKERIQTTLPKAKEIRPFVEKMITYAKNRSQIMAYQKLFQTLRHDKTVKKVITELAQRCAQRPGGYLRILKNGFRYGDNAPMAIIEFCDRAAN